MSAVATESRDSVQELYLPQELTFVQSSDTTSTVESEPLIVATKGVCGGDARIAGTRIPVWMLVESRDAGCTDATFLENYPSLTRKMLNAAWEYARSHGREVYRKIKENREA